MKTAFLSLVLVATCLAVQVQHNYKRPKVPWWETLVSTLPTTETATTTTTTTTSVPGYPSRRLNPSNGNTLMEGVMDTMPSDSQLLTKPPPDFAMLPITNRIVNGHDVNIADYPYQLQLAVYRQQICGASIISRQWAVTAAHCMFNDQGLKIPLNSYTLRAGATLRNRGGSVHMVSTRLIPAPYVPGKHDHDITLLKVSHPFVFNKNVRPIALPAQGQEFRADDVGILSGWGHTQSGGRSSDHLQYVLVPLVSQNKCERSYNTPGRRITSRMLCAGAPGRDSCQGDSGGPLAVKGRLVGIVSFGIGCALPGYPGVNTKVSYYRTFIKQYTGV